MGKRIYDWNKLKPEVMELVNQGKSVKQVLDYIAEKYNKYPEAGFISTKIRAWKKEEQDNG